MSLASVQIDDWTKILLLGMVKDISPHFFP